MEFYIIRYYKNYRKFLFKGLKFMLGNYINSFLEKLS